MRKILSALSLAALLLPMVALGQITTPPQTCTLGRDLSSVSPACTNGATVSIDDYGMCCLLNTISNVTDWIFVILVAVAAVFVILGGVNIVTAGGSPEKVAAGRNYIMYAAVGLLVALLARAVPSIVRLVAGV